MLLLVSKFTSIDIRYSISEKIFVTENLNFILENFNTELVYKTNQKFRSIFHYEEKNIISNHSIDLFNIKLIL